MMFLFYENYFFTLFFTKILFEFISLPSDLISHKGFLKTALIVIALLFIICYSSQTNIFSVFFLKLVVQPF